jgi:hypothetical protein
MRRHRTSVLLAILGALLALALGSAPAAAAAPERRTVTFSVTLHDDLLTEACGVDVTTTISGFTTYFVFPDRPVGLQDIDSIHISYLAVAGDNQVLFKNVGIDLIRVEPDGTVISMATGQAGVFFTGVEKINLTTGEVILEPQRTDDTTRVCRLLTR